MEASKEDKMGYRYKHGGWHNRMYRASVMVDGRPRTVDYQSPFGLNMAFNFIDLRDKVERLFNIRIARADVVERRLLAEWES